MRHAAETVIALAITGEPGRGPSGRRDGHVHWPRFRGPGARGLAEGAPTPVSWDVAKGRSILWTTPIPGLAHSCP